MAARNGLRLVEPDRIGAAFECGRLSQDRVRGQSEPTLRNGGPNPILRTVIKTGGVIVMSSMLGIGLVLSAPVLAAALATLRLKPRPVPVRARRPLRR